MEPIYARTCPDCHRQYAEGTGILGLCAPCAAERQDEDEAHEDALRAAWVPGDKW